MRRRLSVLALAVALGAPAEAQQRRNPLVLDEFIPEDEPLIRVDRVGARPRPDYAPSGLDLDLVAEALGAGARGGRALGRDANNAATGWRLLPVLDLIAGYDDNVFRSETGARSDRILTARPAAMLTTDWSRHAFSVAAFGAVADYGRETSEAFTDYGVRTAARVDVLDELKVRLLAEHVRETNERGGARLEDISSGLARSATVQSRALIDATWRDEIVYARPSLQIRRADTVDAAQANDGDLSEVEAKARLGWIYNPSAIVFIEPRFVWRTIDDPLTTEMFDRSSRGWSVIAGAAVELTGVTQLEAGVGWLHHAYDDARLREISGPAYYARLNWLPRDWLSIAIDLRRSTFDTTTASFAGVVQDSAAVVFEYEFRDNVLLTLAGDLALLDYRGAGPGAPDRFDRTRTLSAGARWLLNERVHLNLLYENRARDSDAPSLDFAANLVTLAMRLQW